MVKMQMFVSPAALITEPMVSFSPAVEVRPPNRCSGYFFFVLFLLISTPIV